MIGRFISYDPLFQAAFDPPTFNRLMSFDYLPKVPPVFAQAAGDCAASIMRTGLNPQAYVRNNPITLVDPLGLVDLYIGPRDTDAQRAQAYSAEYIPSRPGTFSVALHTDLNTGNFIGNDGYRLYTYDLVKKVTTHEKYVSGMEIDLFACGAAEGGADSEAEFFAVSMAIETGKYTQVNAPNKLIWSFDDKLGQYIIADEDANNPGHHDPNSLGQWVPFPVQSQPQSLQGGDISASFSFGGSMGGSSFAYSYGFSFNF